MGRITRNKTYNDSAVAPSKKNTPSKHSLHHVKKSPKLSQLHRKKPSRFTASLVASTPTKLCSGEVNPRGGFYGGSPVIDDGFPLSQMPGEVGWDSSVQLPESSGRCLSDLLKNIKYDKKKEPSPFDMGLRTSPSLENMWRSDSPLSQDETPLSQAKRLRRGKKRGRPTGIKSANESKQILAKLQDMLTKTLVDGNNIGINGSATIESGETDSELRRSVRLSQRPIAEVSPVPQSGNKTVCPSQDPETCPVAPMSEVSSVIKRVSEASPVLNTKTSRLVNESCEDLWTDEELFEDSSFMRASHAILDEDGFFSPKGTSSKHKNSLTPDGTNSKSFPTSISVPVSNVKTVPVSIAPVPKVSVSLGGTTGHNYSTRNAKVIQPKTTSSITSVSSSAKMTTAVISDPVPFQSYKTVSKGTSNTNIALPQVSPESIPPTQDKKFVMPYRPHGTAVRFQKHYSMPSVASGYSGQLQKGSRTSFTQVRPQGPASVNIRNAGSTNYPKPNSFQPRPVGNNISTVKQASIVPKPVSTNYPKPPIVNSFQPRHAGNNISTIKQASIVPKPVSTNYPKPPIVNSFQPRHAGNSISNGKPASIVPKQVSISTSSPTNPVNVNMMTRTVPSSTGGKSTSPLGLPDTSLIGSCSQFGSRALATSTQVPSGNAKPASYIKNTSTLPKPTSKAPPLPIPISKTGMSIPCTISGNNNQKISLAQVDLGLDASLSDDLLASLAEPDELLDSQACLELLKSTHTSSSRTSQASTVVVDDQNLENNLNKNDQAKTKEHRELDLDCLMLDETIRKPVPKAKAVKTPVKVAAIAPISSFNCEEDDDDDCLESEDVLHMIEEVEFRASQEKKKTNEASPVPQIDTTVISPKGRTFTFKSSGSSTNHLNVNREQHMRTKPPELNYANENLNRPNTNLVKSSPVYSNARKQSVSSINCVQNGTCAPKPIELASLSEGVPNSNVLTKTHSLGGTTNISHSSGSSTSQGNSQMKCSMQQIENKRMEALKRRQNRLKLNKN